MSAKLAKLGLAAVLAYGLFDVVTYTSFFVFAFLGYEKSTGKNPAANIKALIGSCPVPKSNLAGVEARMKALSVPPLSFWEKFEDAYELIFVLDDREQLATQISRSRSIIESVIFGCKITVEWVGGDVYAQKKMLRS